MLTSNIIIQKRIKIMVNINFKGYFTVYHAVQKQRMHFGVP